MPERWTVCFAAGFVLVLASFINFLIFNDYPLFRADIAIIVMGIMAICAALAWIYVGTSRFTQALMEALLIGFIVDLNSGQLAIALAAGVAILLFVYASKKSILRLAGTIGAFVVVTSLLGFSPTNPWIATKASGTAPRPAAETRPAIVHIILDEHIGIEGIPQDSPEGRAIKNDLRSFYQSRGFALFGRAYSEHMHTINAIPSILNYGERLGNSASQEGVRIGQTVHFEGLRKSGYRLHVLQSDYADFCSDAHVVTCKTYYSPGIYPLAFQMGTIDRAAIIANKFLALPSWGGFFYRRSLTSSVSGELALHNLAAQVRQAQPGEVHMAHILLPHYPYAFDRNCRILPHSAWLHRHGAEDLQTRQRAYYEQVRCATKQIDLVLNALARSPAGANSIVIIHGDHGSRLTTTDPKAHNAGDYTKADVIAGFSTLFAVRGPRIAPGYRTYPVAAADLLRTVTRSGFEVPPEPKPAKAPTVVVDDADWNPTARVPFPTEW